MTCLDLEGTLVPEIWISVAEKTGIEELLLTTRDEPDYDALMGRRLAILDRHGLGLADIQDVIATMEPFIGARDFISWLRTRSQIVVLSDTFYEFAAPLMERLGWPTLFCNRLRVDGGGRVAGCIIRAPDHKRAAVKAFQGLNYKVFAAGDSFNDTRMLEQADRGALFRASEAVVREFPDLPHYQTYDELKSALLAALDSWSDDKNYINQ